MTIFLPLLVFVFWLSIPGSAAMRPMGPVSGPILFVAGYALLVLGMAAFGRIAARRGGSPDGQRWVWRFKNCIFAARVAVLGWFIIGLCLLGWKALVERLLGPVGQDRWPVELPGLLAGSLPAFAALIGLIWAQYPTDEVVREQTLYNHLQTGRPIRETPGFWAYFNVRLRWQLLFYSAPPIALILIHDVLTLILLQFPWGRQHADYVDSIVSLPSVIAILIFGPEILRRVLETCSLPDCPLRQSLEEISRRHRIGYRDVLLWRTRSQICNAAVMGLFASVRYVLISDLLLETMDKSQVEAVFAHEIGHVRHGHLFWLAGTVAGILLIISGPGSNLADWLDALSHHLWLPEVLQDSLLGALALGMFALIFGYVSRRFERQADVFAARTLQSERDAMLASRAEQPVDTAIAVASVTVAAPAAPPQISAVGREGANIFCGALHQIADINNIPIEARSWSHGSIAKRIRFLHELGTDPAKTAKFDRSMTRLYATLIAGLCIFGVWTAIVAMQPDANSAVQAPAASAIEAVNH